MESFSPSSSKDNRIDLLWVTQSIEQNDPFTISPSQIDQLRPILKETAPDICIRLTPISQAKEILNQQQVGVVHFEGFNENVLELLKWCHDQLPSLIRILCLSNSDIDVIELVNEYGVNRIVTTSDSLNDTAEVFNHSLQISRSWELDEQALGKIRHQNLELSRVTDDLEKVVAERTQHLEEARLEVKRKTLVVRELVRFIEELSPLVAVEEILMILRKEFKKFHNVKDPILGFVTSQKKSIVLFFQGSQIRKRTARRMWSGSRLLRVNENQDRQYLANELSRPVAHVIAVPLAGVNRTSTQGSTATLFVEHSLQSPQLPMFLEFLQQRLEPLSIALDRIVLESDLKGASLTWEHTFDSIEDPVAIIDRDYNLLRSNSAFRQSTDRPKCHSSFQDQSEPCMGCPMSHVINDKQVQAGIVKRGDEVYQVHSYPIRIHEEAVVTTIVNHYENVTRAHELRERMIQNEKMAAIGHLAGHIAHELNNPLTGIRSLAQILLKEVPAETTCWKDLNEVEKASERCQRIITNLLEFSSGHVGEKQVRVPLNRVVETTLPFLKTVMRPYRVHLNLTKKSLPVLVEPHLMQQVVFNIINNACQAMGDHGELKIETSFDQQGQWAQLLVEDTGCGIAPERLDSIFEPFYTTKQEGKGTGLGLSMSQKIVKKFGGSVSVKSQLGQGSQFLVRVPIAGVSD